jgi:hypothetical protein
LPLSFTGCETRAHDIKMTGVRSNVVANGSGEADGRDGGGVLSGYGPGSADRQVV